MSLIEVSVMAGLGLVMIGAFMQVILSSRVDLERLGSKVATVQLRNSMDTALLGNVGSSIFRQDSISPSLPAARECRAVGDTGDFTVAQKIPYSVMNLGGPIFEVGKKLPNSGNITVDEAFLVQMVAEGSTCTTGESSPCHSGECNFMNIVKLSSSRAGWPGNVTIQQPVLCRTQWVASGPSGGTEQLAYCRLNGSAAATPEPSGSPSPCPGDVNFDGYTTQEDYAIVRASQGNFGGFGFSCDHMRFFTPIDLDNNGSISGYDWAPIKENLGCKQPHLKRCFIESPVYYIWLQVANAWSNSPTVEITPEDLQAIEWCLNKPAFDELPPELQPVPPLTPPKTCGAINVDGRKKQLGPINFVPVQGGDVFLARAVSQLATSGPEFAASCPSTIPLYSKYGENCGFAAQPFPGP
jgi:hypothetical protein